MPETKCPHPPHQFLVLSLSLVFIDIGIANNNALTADIPPLSLCDCDTSLGPMAMAATHEENKDDRGITRR